MKNAVIYGRALLALIFLAFAFTAKSTPVTPTLVLTEVSSTTLTYSWDGGAVQTIADITPNYWQFSILDPSNPGFYAKLVDPSFVGTVNINWQEPEFATSGSVNAVSIFQYQDNANQITVYSDASPDTFGTPYSPFANGFVYSFTNYNPQVFDGNTVQFNDDGDVASVPDGAVTAFLLCLSVSGLLLLRRKLGCQFAVARISKN